MNLIFINAKIGLNKKMKIALIIITFIIAGNINDHIEKPEALNTLNSLFLFSFIYVFIDANKKTVGRIIGKSEGMCKIDIFNKIPNSMFLLEPLLISSIKSIEIKRRHEKTKIIKNDKKFSLARYLRIILLLSIIPFLTDC